MQQEEAGAAGGEDWREVPVLAAEWRGGGEEDGYEEDEDGRAARMPRVGSKVGSESGGVKGSRRAKRRR